TPAPHSGPQPNHRVRPFPAGQRPRRAPGPRQAPAAAATAHDVYPDSHDAQRGRAAVYPGRAGAGQRQHAHGRVHDAARGAQVAAGHAAVCDRGRARHHVRRRLCHGAQAHRLPVAAAEARRVRGHHGPLCVGAGADPRRRRRLGSRGRGPRLGDRRGDQGAARVARAPGDPGGRRRPGLCLVQRGLGRRAHPPARRLSRLRVQLGDAEAWRRGHALVLHPRGHRRRRRGRRAGGPGPEGVWQARGRAPVQAQIKM
ncbi:hypothetical protein IWW51_002738, partial [Coemansia sp. RSA 2702]